jgi:hypothetical protein
MTAFSALATATLLFDVPVGSVTDPQGQAATATEPLIVVAYLRPAGYSAQPAPDGVLLGQPMTGRCVAPASLPPTIQAEQRAEAIFWRAGLGQMALPSTGFAALGAYQAFVAANRGSIAIQGEFYWSANIPGGLGVESVLGDKISGRFVARSSWVDSL